MEIKASDMEELAERRGEQIISSTERKNGAYCYRYAVAVGGDSPLLYSIYAEWQHGGVKTVGVIPVFSADRMQAEHFCRLLARMQATPLSLDAIYEDSLTP